MNTRWITSRDNPLLVRLRKQLRSPGGYRSTGQVWLEGDHLCRAAVQRGWALPQLFATEAAALTHADLVSVAADVLLLPPALFDGLSALESPAGLAALVDLPVVASPEPATPSVVLDGLQDAGNVGSILRSAAALGVRQVLTLKGTAALWSPKVLRAGMGAHFGLRLVEGLSLADLDNLALPLVATSSHAPATLPEADLPSPCAWVLGHEGQGVSADLMARCALTVRIPQPGGEESLNVAAAAAICFYESLRQVQ
ncbi:MAG: RNA methyltransferase [Burkholderiaceae bacterium]|nr:RNA methyltransferase [Burkholderiaceae bacterium]